MWWPLVWCIETLVLPMTFVDQSSPIIQLLQCGIHRSLQRRFEFDNILWVWQYPVALRRYLRSIKSRSCPKSRWSCDVFSRHSFRGRDPKCLIEFYKSGSLSNMWQSLVAIDGATSGIRRRKNKDQTTAAKQNGRLDQQSCRVVIKISCFQHQPFDCRYSRKVTTFWHSENNYMRVQWHGYEID